MYGSISLGCIYEYFDLIVLLSIALAALAALLVSVTVDINAMLFMTLLSDSDLVYSFIDTIFLL